MITVLVWLYAGVLIGLAVFLLAAEGPLRKVFRHWQSHNRRIDADIEFMRSIPQGMEGEK